MKRRDYTILLRSILLAFLLVFSIRGAISQVTIGSGNKAHESAALDIHGIDKGVLIPRVSLKGQSDMTTIANPAEGLIIYNLTDGNNDTPLNPADDVFKDMLYVHQKGRWYLMYNEAKLIEDITESKVPQILVLGTVKPKGQGRDYSFVSSDLGNGIRKYMFDDVVRNTDNCFNTSTGEFTAPNTGYYQIKMNILLRPRATNTATTNLWLGISKPFTGSFPTSGATNSNFSNYTNIINPGQDPSKPAYVYFSTTVFLTKGQKIVPLAKKITTTDFSLDVDYINYKRETTNRLAITYLPVSAN